MSTPPNAITITILDKEYMVACPEEEREDLLSSAQYLDQRMKETRDNGKVLGTERIAVMTALNIVNDLLRQQREKDQAEQTVNESVRNLKSKIEHALSRRHLEEGVD
tara:strand:+ start:309 stop:629 length:321 start_codon:yes stop_codon:yes gene_type:complete